MTHVCETSSLYAAAEVIMDSALTRVIESSQRVAQSHCKANGDAEMEGFHSHGGTPQKWLLCFVENRMNMFISWKIPI